MTDLELWQQKLIQLLHDPPGKLFYFAKDSGGHKAIASELLEATAGVPLKFVGVADQAASGADRPVNSPPSKTKGVSQIIVRWPSHAILTHPLASGKAGSNAIHLGEMQGLRGTANVQALAGAVKHALGNLVERPDEPEEVDKEEALRQQQQQEAELAKKLPCWNDAKRLREICFQLWRRMPETVPPNVPRVVWELQPADSRTPDHSLWDHLRVASALAFITKRKNEGDVLPWLVVFSIGPVQSFIAQSRTSSDLWTSSILLSDLVWHAMQPFVERYGPEAIVYPDLRGNPRADLWLYQQQHEKRLRDVLPPDANPCSFAGIFPNTFIALVPREGIEEVTTNAEKSFEKRWGQLATLAKNYFVKQAPERTTLQRHELEAFHRIWDQQHRIPALTTCWSAAAWPNFKEVEVDEPSALAVRQGLPAQSPPPDLSPKNRKALDTWRNRHTPWIPTEAFARYAEARYVYAMTNLGMHQSQRGFDYPLIHHALHLRHAARKGEAQGATMAEEVGEKCTLCGERQALHGSSDDLLHQSIDSQRDAVRAFWEKLDRNSEGGAERLCGVCTMKRYVVRAGVPERRTDDTKAVDAPGLTAAWAGPDMLMGEVLDEDKQLRVPFPSTATMAAQGYLCDVVSNEKLRPLVAAVVRCCERANLPRTTFVRALRSLADVSESNIDAVGKQFLQYEAELTVFHEAIGGIIARVSKDGARGAPRDKDGNEIPPDRWKDLQKAVAELRKEAKRSAGSQVAMVAIDGDGIRKLLLGKELGARWRDVIHPNAVTNMETNPVTQKAGWPTLLDATRLMGPSAHACINRVLASFVHTIVPWVVEREFHGRLIYAGGDDVLALMPAGEALDMCARLAQLYSAAWVIDTQPKETAWNWRRRNATFSGDADPKERFVAVKPNESGEPAPWPIPAELRSPWLEPGGKGVDATGEEALLPMMGARQTISAGIAIGHYKTPLGELVKAAWDERDRAKRKKEEVALDNEEPKKGNACSIRRFSRGGEKARLRFSWGKRGEAPEVALEGYLRVKRVSDAFAKRTLPGRVPYKLRDVQEFIFAAWECEREKLAADLAPNKVQKELEDRVKPVAMGLFCTQVGESPDGFAIWWEGLREELEAYEERKRDPNAEKSRREQPNSEQGLAVCRYLGALAREEQGEQNEQERTEKSP